LISKAKARLRSALDSTTVESVGLAPLSQGEVRPRSRHAIAILLTAALAAAAYAFLAAGSATLPAAADTCPNAAFRTGPSANLPDCRAYELVTPPDTNGVPPYGGVGELNGFVTQGGPTFNSPLANSSGDSYMFSTVAVPIPGTDAPGYGNQYRAQRGLSGWTTSLAGPNAIQDAIDQPGGFSADHGYWSFLVTHNEGRYNGTLDLNNSSGVARWIRYPDGTMHLVGEGTIPASPDTDGYPNGFADDSTATPRFISPDGSHIVFDTGNDFASAVQLTADAPPSGTKAVYDRTPGGLQVVSLLPGDVTPTADSNFQGSSKDGSVVMFGNGSTLYARVNGSVTDQIADGSALPVGGVLTCSAGPGSATTMKIQWLRNGAPVPGETGTRYTTSASDAGALIQCQVVALNANAGSIATSQGVVVAPAPATPAPSSGSAGLPQASGDLTVGGGGGQTITCPTDSWTGSPTFAYQWYRNGVALSGNGADTDTYTVQAADLSEAAVFQCLVTGTNASGSRAVASQTLATTPGPDPAAPEASAQTNDASITPGGLSDDGSKAFYAQAGDLFSFDTSTQQTAQINTTGDAQFVQPSPDGSHVYFVSPSQLDGSNGTPGADNLYVWNGSATTYVATLDASDLDRLTTCGPSCAHFGLIAWAQQPGLSQLTDPAKNDHATRQASRVTPDGSKILFESKAQLTSYDNSGHFELYRYDASDQSLVCVSCNPSGAPAAGDARLSDYDHNFIGSASVIPNISDDGQTVFFESSDSLLPGDSNGLEDVYEWHAGQLSLLSSGKSSQPTYLTAATPDGTNAFIFTADRLIAGGQEPGVPGIYDARVDGGFPPPAGGAPPCVGDACQGAPTPPPSNAGPGSSGFSGPGNQGKNRGGGTTAPKQHKKCKKHKKQKGCKKHKKSRRVISNRGGSK
jgi:hypothetical protein